MSQPRLIRVYRDDTIPAFGGWLAGSMSGEQPTILLNVAACLCPTVDETGEEVPSTAEDRKWMMITTLMHEFGHALQEFFDLEFTEDQVEKISYEFEDRMRNGTLPLVSTGLHSCGGQDCGQCRADSTAENAESAEEGFPADSGRTADLRGLQDVGQWSAATLECMRRHSGELTAVWGFGKKTDKLWIFPSDFVPGVREEWLAQLELHESFLDQQKQIETVLPHVKLLAVDAEGIGNLVYDYYREHFGGKVQKLKATPQLMKWLETEGQL